MPIELFFDLLLLLKFLFSLPSLTQDRDDFDENPLHYQSYSHMPKVKAPFDAKNEEHGDHCYLSHHHEAERIHQPLGAAV